MAPTNLHLYIRRSFQQVEGLLHEEKKRLIRDIAPNGHDT